MSLGRLIPPRAVTPLLGLVVLVVISLGWGRGPEPAAAATIAGSALQAGGSCPLTGAQQVASAKAWQKMMPVFRHPRCLNCHGGIPDPLPDRGQASRMHVGVVRMDTTDDNRTCEECHMTDWGQPGAPNWATRSDTDLCRGMHVEFEGSAPDFLDHMIRDKRSGIPFIKAAFEGKRGLLEGGQTIFENATGRRFQAEPPPGTHAKLVQQARDWVQAQGGSFVGDKDCGCVISKVEVHFQSTMTIVDQRSATHAITSTITGQGSIVLKLGPEASAPEWDAATGLRGESGNITWSGITISEPTGCTGQVIIKSSPATSFKFWLGMSLAPELKFSLEIIPGTDLHDVLNRCRLPNGTFIASPMNDPISIFSGAWSSLHGPGAGTGGMSAMDLTKPPPAAAAGMPDMSKLMTMDPKAMAAMMESLKGMPPAQAAAEMQKFLSQTMPGAGKLVAAAKNNFKFAIPDGKWCTVGTGTPFLAQCQIVREVSVGGTGTTLKITEKTTITIGRPRA